MGYHGNLATVFCLTVLITATSTTSVSHAQDVIKRGTDIGPSSTVNLEEALQDLDRYTEQTVILEGTVNKVCAFKGCWMELVPDNASRGVRVTFKDYAFFVPTDSTGYDARLEGLFEQNIFSKAAADHLIAEGVALQRNPDGTATEVSFVAQAVELRQ